MNDHAAGEPRLTHIRPPDGWPLPDLAELWAYRDVLLILIWRDIALRYRQTVVGVAWALLQPLLTTLAASLLLGRLVGGPAGSAPYPLLTFSALVPWVYLTHALTRASLSVVEHQTIITRVYFPRLLIPLAAVLAALVDLGVASLALVGVLALAGRPPGLGALLLPAVVGLLLLVTIGPGLWLAALNVEFRDIGNALPFLMQLLLLLTPVFYPSTLVPPEWSLLYGLNPLVGVVVGFRQALLGSEEPLAALWLAESLLVGSALLAGGLIIFQQRAEAFADVV